jgi:hypothetical protein
MADGPLPQQPASTDQQQIASASILLQIVMLGLSFVLGHVLRRHKVYYINEASASLLLGKVFVFSFQVSLSFRILGMDVHYLFIIATTTTTIIIIFFFFLHVLVWNLQSTGVS